MIKTAIEFVQTKEEIEKERASSAHEKLEDVLRHEQKLEADAKEAHHDAVFADEVIETYESGEFGEDRELRREEAVADISHHVEDYVKARLSEAKDAELRAKEEEDDAKKSLEELQKQEQDLKITLGELMAYEDEQKEKQ